MGCMNSVSFSILLNDSATTFFQVERGLCQGCTLSPLLFLLVAEELSRFLAGAKMVGRFTGIKISNGMTITHLLFVDDILIFCDGSYWLWSLIIFLIQRSLLSAMSIPHEVFAPRSMYSLPRGGVQRGGTPFAGSGGKRAPSEGSGAKHPNQKLPYKSIL
jgi:hypothetical protein